MQLFIKVAKMTFGSGELSAIVKRKKGAKLSTWTEWHEIGELYYEDWGHIVRIQSLAEVVPLAVYVDADINGSVRQEPLHFANILAFFAAGTYGHVVDNTQLSYFKDQLGFGASALKNISCLDPVVTNGEHACYMHQRGLAIRDDRLIKVTTRLADMSMSKVVLCTWQGLGRM